MEEKHWVVTNTLPETGFITAKIPWAFATKARIMAGFHSRLDGYSVDAGLFTRLESNIDTQFALGTVAFDIAIEHSWSTNPGQQVNKKIRVHMKLSELPSSWFMTYKQYEVKYTFLDLV